MKTNALRKIGVVGVLLVLALLLSVSAVGSQSAQPLTIAFYGNPNSTAALGMQVAVNEINSLGVFAGGDGGTYELRALITEDSAALEGALAVLIAPDAPELPAGTRLQMPVILLSPDASLAPDGVEAPFFRGMTPRRVMYDALADFASTRSSGLERVALIGDGESFGESFAALEAELRRLGGGDLGVLTIAESLPSPEQVTELTSFNPQMVVYRGDGASAGAIIEVLDFSGWSGTFVYEDAYEAAQAGELSASERVQVVGMSTWANSASDALSAVFRQTFVTETGRLPDALAVSAYDVTWAMRLMVQRVGANPATLAARLPTTDIISTTQGSINPANSANLFSAVSLYQIQPLGGAAVFARYDQGAFIEDQTVLAALPTPTPQASATPSQATVLVTSQVLNIRTGPGLEYPRIGQFKRGDQIVVLGTVPDYSWYYVQATNGLGWVKAEFVQIFLPDGNLANIPQVPIPPTPTPGATAVPATPADLVIENVVLDPPRPIKNQPFTATVTLRNDGATGAGSFAVAASWNPGEVFSSVIVPGLAPFETVTAILQATLTQTGAASVAVVADLNNEVAESNETNNTYTVNYVADAAPTIATQSTYPINQLNFAGAFTDIDWTGATLDGINGATVGIINGVPYEQVHAGMLTAAAITNPTVGTIAAGTIFGMRTGEAHCGVFRIDSVVGANITLTFRMYAIADC